MFGRATITLGIGPHSSITVIISARCDETETFTSLTTSLSLSFVVNFPTSFDSVRPRPDLAY